MMAIVASAVVMGIRLIANAVLRHKELEMRTEQQLSPVSDERMARLEMAVESIALEVERISEGQRFTTKLLSDAAKQMAPRLDRPKKQDTPH
jgi:sensor c-di-GMP phosphodiesterase-like protein